MVALRGGQDYPRSVGEFLSWFGTDADCRDYLAWLRWPDGFVCDECGHIDGWQLADGRWECAACSHRTSVTAATIFDRTRTPLTVWFHACWSFATAKDGSSALACSAHFRSGPTRPRVRCCTVCVLCCSGPVENCCPGRWRLTRPTSAVRRPAGRWSGQAQEGARRRCRGSQASHSSLAVPDARHPGWLRQRAAHVHHRQPRPRSTVITDRWSGYLGIDKVCYTHDRRSQRAAKALARTSASCCPAYTA